jgi:hypothetical protein
MWFVLLRRWLLVLVTRCFQRAPGRARQTGTFAPNYSSFLELVKSSDLVRLTVSWHARLMWGHGKKIRGFFWVCLAGRRTLSHARRKERRRCFVQIDGAILLSN